MLHNMPVIQKDILSIKSTKQKTVELGPKSTHNEDVHEFKIIQITSTT